ncbi:MAG: hypothetical protein LWW86_02345 [Micrococcales bacterium]|nr:hypothetical protein [Micrococcales bacterium]
MSDDDVAADSLQAWLAGVLSTHVLDTHAARLLADCTSELQPSPPLVGIRGHLEAIVRQELGPRRTAAVTRFVGVSRLPGRGIHVGVGPYEFWTDDQVPITLHDTEFLGLVETSDCLRLFFNFDPEWVPADALETPIVALGFESARVVTSGERSAGGSAQPGWVYSFEWDGGDEFELHTETLALVFTAAEMRVHLLPAAPPGLTRVPCPG